MCFCRYEDSSGSLGLRAYGFQGLRFRVGSTEGDRAAHAPCDAAGV